MSRSGLGLFARRTTITTISANTQPTRDGSGGSPAEEHPPCLLGTGVIEGAGEADDGAGGADGDTDGPRPGASS